MRICYHCEIRKPDDKMQWKSSDNPDRGLCQRCHEIGNVKEEMEHRTRYPGVPMTGFEKIMVREGEKIVCPFCGNVADDYFEDPELYQEQDDYEYLCQECEEEFLLSIHVRITYTSRIDISREDAENRYTEIQDEKRHTDSQDKG